MSEIPPAVQLEHLILESLDDPLLRRCGSLLQKPMLETSPFPHYPTRVAPGATRQGVSAEAYHAYRTGLAAACADVVLVAERERCARVALLRRARPPFGDCWWIMGGVVFNYRPIQQFLLWKAHTECGLTTLGIDEFVAQNRLDDCRYSCGDVHIVGCLGAYRTAAEDTTDPTRVCDTINLCYMALFTGTGELRHDRDHTNARWASFADLEREPCGYWYPEHVARRALAIYTLAQ